MVMILFSLTNTTGEAGGGRNLWGEPLVLNAQQSSWISEFNRLDNFDHLDLTILIILHSPFFISLFSTSCFSTQPKSKVSQEQVTSNSISSWSSLNWVLLWMPLGRAVSPGFNMMMMMGVPSGDMGFYYYLYPADDDDDKDDLDFDDFKDTKDIPSTWVAG